MLAAVQMRRILILLGAGLVLAGPFVLGYRLSAGSRATTPVAIPSVVDEVRSALADRYYRPVPERVLELGSVNQMISALRDPYTAYLTPPDYRLVRQETASTYTGIGISVLPSRHGYVVVSLPSGPARRAGVHVGDTIVRIGGTAARRLSVTHALTRILGPRGTTVHLSVVRSGHTLDFRIRRELIQAPVVQARLLSYAGERWGDVRLSGFRIGAARTSMARIGGCARCLGRACRARSRSPQARTPGGAGIRARSAPEPGRAARPGRRRVVAFSRPRRRRLARREA
jgi:hypothetical protein